MLFRLLFSLIRRKYPYPFVLGYLSPTFNGNLQVAHLKSYLCVEKIFTHIFFVPTVSSRK